MAELVVHDDWPVDYVERRYRAEGRPMHAVETPLGPVNVTFLSGRIAVVTGSHLKHDGWEFSIRADYSLEQGGVWHASSSNTQEYATPKLSYSPRQRNASYRRTEEYRRLVGETLRQAVETAVDQHPEGPVDALLVVIERNLAKVRAEQDVLLAKYEALLAQQRIVLHERAELLTKRL